MDYRVEHEMGLLETEYYLTMVWPETEVCTLSMICFWGLAVNPLGNLTAHVDSET